ncbi:MAG: hypothetical protein MHPSP_000822, partial [Paramarteilia canceri]
KQISSKKLVIAVEKWYREIEKIFYREKCDSKYSNKKFHKKIKKISDELKDLNPVEDMENFAKKEVKLENIFKKKQKKSKLSE